MKSLFIILSACFMLTGCGGHSNVFNEWYKTNIKPFDPKDGDWIFISNEPGGQYLKRTQDWDINSGTRPIY